MDTQGSDVAPVLAKPEVLKFSSGSREGEIRIWYDAHRRMRAFQIDEMNDPDMQDACHIIGGLLTLCLEFRVPMERIAALIPKEGRSIPVHGMRIFIIRAGPDKQPELPASVPFSVISGETE